MFIVIAVISLIVSIIMSGVAWRLAREERRRSQARVAALTSDLADLELRPTTAFAPGADLFRAEEPDHSRSRFAGVLAVGGFAVAMALALIVVTSQSSQSAAQPRMAQAPRPAATGLKPLATTEFAPLELLALGHEREGDRIIVRGIVRNPTGGVERDRVAVVVLLLNRDGGFLASGRAAVEVPGLAPGSQSGFVVTVPHANEVGRYRVSFRSDDRIVPHVDRRDRGPIAQMR
jgi:hypothetical protein